MISGVKSRTACLGLVILSSAFAACGTEPPPQLPPPTMALPTGNESIVSDAPRPQHHRRHKYPDARREAVSDTIFDKAVADPYRWLEDGKSDETRAWMKEEDDAARAVLQKLPERDAIAARLKEVYYVDSLGVPGHRGNRYFVTWKKAEDEKAIVYVRDGKNGKDRVLLNPNEWSADGSSSLGSTAATHDGRYMAYTVKANNSDEATMYVIDVATGKKLEKDVIPGAKYASASWTPSGDGFYYTWLPTDPALTPAERPGYAEVRFHKLGTDPATDAVVRGRTNDATTFLHGWLSWDGNYLFHELAHGWASEQVFVKDLRKKEVGWTELAPGQKAHYDVEEYKDQLYVATDEGAPHQRVFRVDVKNLDRDAWKEIIPEPKDESIRSVAIRGGKLTVTYLKNAFGRLELRALDGKIERDVTLPGIGSVTGVSGLPDDDESWFSYTSFTDTWQSFALLPKTGKTSIYSTVKVPFDATPYMTTQVFYPSKDGTKISMFIVHRKDLAKGKPQRTLLYGYGGFQSTETPSFNSGIIPWLERGGIYAVANLRGGSEYGEEWHQNGMLEKKQNVFDDFIGAGEFLIREGYTDSSRLVISGGSNGGLLVGAAMTQRPELFAAVLCGVPLLDMVRYHRFGSGKTWVSEYGSAEDASQFKALFAYSPYHHVVNGTRYPALLVLSADSDDRVDPMHARKFVAQIQAASEGGPALLRIEKNSGHGGADLRKAEVEKGADRWAFALAHTKP